MVTACCVHCGSISRVCCFLVGHATNLTWTCCRLFSCWFTRWATPWRMTCIPCQVVGQLYWCGYLKDNKWRTVIVVWNLAVLSIRLSCTSAPSDVDDQLSNDHVEQHCLLDNDIRTRDKKVRGMSILPCSDEPIRKESDGRDKKVRNKAQARCLQQEERETCIFFSSLITDP